MIGQVTKSNLVNKLDDNVTVSVTPGADEAGPSEDITDINESSSIPSNTCESNLSTIENLQYEKQSDYNLENTEMMETSVLSNPVLDQMISAEEDNDVAKISNTINSPTNICIIRNEKHTGSDNIVDKALSPINSSIDTDATVSHSTKAFAEAVTVTGSCVSGDFLTEIHSKQEGVSSSEFQPESMPLNNRIDRVENVQDKLDRWVDDEESESQPFEHIEEESVEGIAETESQQLEYTEPQEKIGHDIDAGDKNQKQEISMEKQEAFFNRERFITGE